MTTSARPNLEQRATTLATQLVDELVAALVNTRIYETSHPRVQNSIRSVRDLVRDLLELLGDASVRIGVADQLLIFRRRPLIGASMAASRLMQVVSAWQAGGLEIDLGATASDVNLFFTTVQERPQPGEGFAELNHRLEERGCRNARLLPPYSETVGESDTNSRKAVPLPVKFYQSVIDTLQNTTISICLGGQIEFQAIEKHAEEVLKSLEADDGPLLNLARQDQYDAFTFGHSVRVSVLSMNLARAMSDDRELLRRIGTAALLHDVGKALIPFEILHSSTKLSEEERRQMARHPALGSELLLDHRDSDPLAIASAFGHHIAGPGRGYPKTRHEHQVSIVTEIVRVCDVYEALTAARPYKQPMTPTRAYRVMLSMKGQFNRQLLRRFIEVNGIYPNGQLVELDTGEQARVVRQGSEPTTPVVQVLTDDDGNLLGPEDQALVDLGTDNASRVIRCVPTGKDGQAPKPGPEAVVGQAAEAGPADPEAEAAEGEDGDEGDDEGGEGGDAEAPGSPCAEELEDPAAGPDAGAEPGKALPGSAGRPPEPKDGRPRGKKRGRKSKRD